MEHSKAYIIAEALVEKEDEKFDENRIKQLKATLKKYTGNVYYKKNSFSDYDSEYYWVVNGFYDDWHADVTKWSHYVNREHVRKSQREYIRDEITRSSEYIYHEKYECMSSKQNFWNTMETADPQKFEEFKLMMKEKLKIE